MPDVARSVTDGVEIDAPCGFRIRGAREELQPDAGGIAAEQREIDATLGLMGAEGQRNAGPHIDFFAQTGHDFVPTQLRDIHFDTLPRVG